MTYIRFLVFALALVLRTKLISGQVPCPGGTPGGELLPDISDCTTYYICEPETGSVSKSCPPGWHFDDGCKEGPCPDGMETMENRRKRSAITCPSAGSFPILEDCHAYYTCIEYQEVFFYFNYTCASGFHFDAAGKTCAPGPCHTTTTTTQAPTTMKPTDSPSTDITCPSAGSFPVLEDCQAYYTCLEYQEVWFYFNYTCASGYHFDAGSQVCAPGPCTTTTATPSPTLLLTTTQAATTMRPTDSPSTTEGSTSPTTPGSTTTTTNSSGTMVATSAPSTTMGPTIPTTTDGETTTAASTSTASTTTGSTEATTNGNTVATSTSTPPITTGPTEATTTNGNTVATSTSTPPITTASTEAPTTNGNTTATSTSTPLITTGPTEPTTTVRSTTVPSTTTVRSTATVATTSSPRTSMATFRPTTKTPATTTKYSCARGKGNYIDPSDCHKYYTCVQTNGIWHYFVYTCVRGYVFNSNLQACNVGSC